MWAESMTRQAFDDLVKRIERRYAGRPTALERSTSAWVVIGLAGIVSYLVFLFFLGAPRSPWESFWSSRSASGS